MSKQCSSLGCLEYPSAYCKCQFPSIYFCKTHLQSHPLSYQRRHEINYFTEAISLPTLEKFLSLISTQLSKLSEMESKILALSLAIIEKVQSESERIFKKISETKRKLNSFIATTLKYSLIDLEEKEIIEKILGKDPSKYEATFTHLLNSVSKNLKEKENPRKTLRLHIVNSKELCKECKISYFIKVGEHYFCDTCRVCYCQKCLKNTSCQTDDFKKEKLEVGKNPIRTISEVEQNTNTLIYEGYNKTLKKNVSITKVITSNSKQSSYSFNIMKFLSNKLPSFLWVNGSNVKKNESFIVTERISYTLAERIQGNIDSELAMKISKALIEGFCYMSLYRIYHRNISLDTILLTDDFCPKIYDFNIATIHSTDCNSNKLSEETLSQGKDGFLAPERRVFMNNYRNKIKTDIYNIEKSDVFSLGIVLLVLFTKFSAPSELQFCFDVKMVKEKIIGIENKTVGKIIRKMLDPNPTSRPYFREVLEMFNAIRENNNFS